MKTVPERKKDRRVGSANTKRQEALYTYLLMRGSKWTTMEQTTDSISLYPAFFTSNYHNSDARRMLTTDIQAINTSNKYEKIIISNNRGIKLATEREAEAWLNHEASEVFQKLKRIRQMSDKISRNGQISLEGRICEAFLAGGDKGG